ncbi:MAG: rRNA maturation RNase YbeY [Erysipelotrichaceae bacterium]|nr:rRNA maturation RNase YbeY [Erysipelotrichaceae bacterium]
MEFSFDNRLDEAYDALETVYEELMSLTFSLLGVKKNYEVDVSLVDEEEIHRINREYRKVDRVTDVISFAFEDDDSALGMINGDDVPRMLGEIFICVPRALEQAKEIGNTPERELSFLFVHGLLHLLGYDHMKKEDEDVMFPLQDKILDAYKEAKR